MGEQDLCPWRGREQTRLFPFRQGVHGLGECVFTVHAAGQRFHYQFGCRDSDNRESTLDFAGRCRVAQCAQLDKPPPFHSHSRIKSDLLTWTSNT
jgi:hypothetical protein